MKKIKMSRIVSGIPLQHEPPVLGAYKLQKYRVGRKEELLLEI